MDALVYMYCEFSVVSLIISSVSAITTSLGNISINFWERKEKY